MIWLIKTDLNLKELKKKTVALTIQKVTKKYIFIIKFPKKNKQKFLLK